MYIGVLKD